MRANSSFSSFDRVPKNRDTPLENRCHTRPTAQRKKNAVHHYKNKIMMHTVCQRTQVDGCLSYEYPAVLVLVPSDSYTIPWYHLIFDHSDTSKHNTRDNASPVGTNFSSFFSPTGRAQKLKYRRDFSEKPLFFCLSLIHI